MKNLSTQYLNQVRLVALVSFLSLTTLHSQQTITNTWTSGDLPMDYASTISAYVYNAACTEELTLTLPTGDFYRVTGVDITYDIEAVGNGYKSEQRSRILFSNNDVSESWTNGSGYESGTYHYNRTNVSIANGVYPGGTDLIFELQAFRTYSSTSGDYCNMTDQKILNNTWSITVHFEASEPITCPAPDNLSVENMTTTSADFSWDETASATEWEVKYGAPGFDPESAGTSISGLSNKSTTISGLSAGTSYDTYVRAVCGTDDLSSWSGPESFTTAFEPIANDACSGAIMISVGDTKIGTTQGATTTHTDCNSGKEVWYTFTGTGSAIEIDLVSDLDNVMVLYKGNCGSLSEIQCVDNIFPGGGENFTLNSVNNQTYFLTIGSYEDSYYPAFMGSFTLSLSEGCGVVSNLQAPAYPDAHSVTLSWDGPASDAEYQIQYGVDNTPFSFDADETINNISKNSYTITGLSPNTSYDVRIRTVCGGGEYSTWTTWGFTTRQQTINNDLCSDAVTVTCGNTYEDQPLSGATAQNSIVFDHCTSNIPGVWYKYTPSGTSDQDVKLTFSDFDPRTTGLGVRLKVSVVSGINCSIDEFVSCFEINRYYPYNAFTAHPGETYYIYVASINLNDYNNVSFDMEVSCGSYSSDSYHDVCDDPGILECDDTDTGNTDNATDNVDDPESNIGRGNWHTFTGDGKNATITIESYENIDFNGHLASGSCSSLTKVASLNSVGDEDYTFTTTAGTTYYLYVGAAGNHSYETGPYSVSLTCSDCDPIAIPTLSDLPGKTVYLDDEGSASITVEELAPGLQTICSVASVTASPLTFDCNDVGTPVDVALTVTDLSGNKNEGTIRVTVVNNMNPEPKCEDITINLDNTGNASLSIPDVDRGVDHNCIIEGVSLSKYSFTRDDLGENAVTLTMTDLNGNKGTCTSTVTVVENRPPEAKCKDFVLELDASGIGTLDVSDIDNGSTDFENDIITTTLSKTSFNCSNIGFNTVTLTVADSHGNSSTCTSKVTVVDNTTPRFISTPKTPVLVNDEGDIPDPFPVTYSDNCSADMTYIENQTATGCGHQLKRTWTITDQSGHEDHFSQTIVFDGSLQKDIEPVAVHMSGLHSGDTLHVEKCIPYDISPDDLNAGKDPNARIKTNIYRLPLPEHHERGMYAFYQYSYIVTDHCDNSNRYDYYLALYDLSPPVFRNFPRDIAIANKDDVPPVPQEVRSIDICQYVKWDTVVTFAVTDPHSMDTLAFVRRWIAEDQSGNLGYRDQFINIDGTQRHDFGTISLRIGQKEDINRSHFQENAGTNGIQVHLLRYNDDNELEAVDSMVTDTWNGLLGNAVFTPLPEGTFRLRIDLPDGYSVLPGPDSLFAQNGWSDTLQVGSDSITNLGMITLINQPPNTDTILDLSKEENSFVMETATTKSKPAAILFPNPTNGRITIQTESKRPLRFYLRDISGRLVRKGIIEDRLEIDISSRPQGIYTIQLVSDDQVIETKKVVLVE